MGSLVMYTAVGTKTVAYGGQAPAAVEGLPSRKIQSAPSYGFRIPAGTLDGVLAAFEAACGAHVNVLNPGLLQVSSPGVSGFFTMVDALRELLAGTGIVYHISGPLAFSLEIQGVAATVDVHDVNTALGGSSGKYTQSVLDTPQTISVVPSEVLEQQGTSTLRDALRNVAGISLAAGEGGAQGDNLTIRGFTARNDLFIDGMRDFGSYYRDPFNTQEVEVLQGPSSVTFGRGSTGGVVNQATKTPGLNRFISGDLDFGTDLTRRVALDLDQPLPSLAKGAAFRLNLMGDEGS